MIVDSLSQFQKQLVKGPRSILILSKEKAERDEALKVALKGKPLRFNKESFDPKAFISEFENSSFLLDVQEVVVEEVDKIDIKLLERACKLAGSTILIMVGETMPSKLQELVALVVKFPPKRTYEKEADLALWMVERAKERGCLLLPDTARFWVKSFGLDKALLVNELEKLLCYVGYQGEITLALVREFSITLPHLTLWQLGDALFAKERRQAWTVLHTLLEEGGSLYQILSHLRSQMESGLQMLDAHKRGKLTQEFPYLKGSLGQKKISLLSGFGQKNLKRALSLLFEAELKAKSMSVDADLLLEPLIVRLTA